MKRTILFVVAAMCVFAFTGCEPGTNTATNTANSANSNANTAKTTAAAPTKEALMEMDRKAHASWFAGDTKWFEENLSDKFVAYNDGKRMSKADEVKMISDSKCEGSEAKLDEEQLVKLNDDTYALVYRGTYDAECTLGGQKMKLPSSVRAATVWMRDGDKWKAAFHGETPIIDPTKPPAAAPAKPDTKKEEPKKDAPAANTAANAASAPAPAKPTPSANTEALTKLHNGGWEAWRTNDAKWFNDTMIESVSYVDPMGVFHSGKAALTKLWTDAAACEGVTKTSFADTFASAVSPTVEILTGKGTADGKCEGQANAPLHQTAIYVKEGDAWKLAFMFSTPAN
jgi:ketosteroid isomerase-like protein